MPEPLSHLLRHSWKFFVVRFRTVLFGAIVFTILSAGVRAFFIRQADTGLESVIAGAGITREDLAKTFQTKIADKDFSSMAVEIDRLTQLALTQPDKTDPDAVADHALGRYLLLIWPLFFLSAFVSFVIAFVSSAFYLLLAVKGEGSAYDMSRALTQTLPGHIGVFLWSLARSFVWVPFIGIPLAIWLLPRFVFAPVIRLRGGKSVFQSVSLSFAYSRGYWFTIVGNLLAALMVCILCLWVAAAFIGPVTLFSPKAGLVMEILVQQLLLAFLTIYVARMATGYMQGK